MNHAGTAFYVNEYTMESSRLPNNFSIFSAELQGILMALRYVKDRSTDCIILTDSRSALIEISKYEPLHPVAKEVLLILQQTNNNIKFLWIPSHIGINGNERVDTLAKETAQLPISNVQVPPDDAYQYIKRLIIKKWDIQWNNASGNKLREIRESTKPWFSSASLSRRNSTIISRLRIGHTNITHKFIFTNEEPPICQHCNQRLTVTHILIECPKYIEERRTCDIPLTMIESLGDNIDNLKKTIEFLKKINIYHEI